MDPNFAVAHYDLGQALVQKHMCSEAVAALEPAISFLLTAQFASSLELTLTPCQAVETKPLRY